MPPELKAQVEEAARTAGRSINAEIVHRLERSFTPTGTDAMLTKIADKLEALAAWVEPKGPPPKK